MKLVLAFDTATEEVAIGLGAVRAQGVHAIAEINLDVPRASLTHLVPSISRLLDSVGRDIREVRAVIVGRGPGSFTGVRIGVATAKGVAQGLGVPLYGVGTLDAVAERYAQHEGLLGVVGDAMRKEVYPALFSCGGGKVVRLGPDAVARPADAAAEWAAGADCPLLLAGNGLRKYAPIFAEALGERASVAPESSWTPTGESLLLAAWRDREAGRAGDGDPAVVLPVYTRLSDAEENESARTGSRRLLTDSGVAGPSGTGGR